MNMYLYFLMTLIPFTITGCSGNGGGAGHWFHIIFISIPAGISLYVINKKLDYLHDAVSKQDNKISNLSSRLDKNTKSGK